MSARAKDILGDFATSDFSGSDRDSDSIGGFEEDESSGIGDSNSSSAGSSIVNGGGNDEDDVDVDSGSDDGGHEIDPEVDVGVINKNVTDEESVNNGATNNPFYFEGVEKLLEIWFTKVNNNNGNSSSESENESNGKNGECSLRRIPRYQLEEMLKLVHCEIIDSISNDEIDSYVLSESSLFVSQRRLILKTCGTTTPLQCLKFLWTLVKDYTGFDTIEDVYYSHKNYKRPHMQKMPYQKFDNEVKLLDDFFAGSHGSAYCLGSMTRDCWYLYTYHAPISQKHHHTAILHHRWNNNLLGQTEIRSRHNHNNHHNRHLSAHNHNHGYHHNEKKKNCHHNNHHNNRLSMKGLSKQKFAINKYMDEPDQTLEILMSELDQSVMEIFTKKGSQSAAEATQKSGIKRIIPGMEINDHLFEPCGYSMNGIVKDEGTYMTIHITPEAEFSYVSFETNVALSSYKDVIKRVLNVFRPGKFVLTFFANKASKGYPAHQEMVEMDLIQEQWLRLDNQFCQLEKNDLTYALYTKFPS